IDAPAIVVRFLPRTGLRRRETIPDFLWQNCLWQNSSRGCHRIPRHPEWFRDSVHHRRPTYRRSLQRQSTGPSPLVNYTRPHVLVIDEVGYLSYGPDAANVLFHVVNDRHLRKRPMIFTTNKQLNDWGKVLHDEDMAAAILHPHLEPGRLIHLD